MMRLIIISSFIVIFNLVNIFEADGSIDPKTLATQWAPRVFFHQKESYFPISVNEFLENTQCSQPNTPPVTTIPTGPPSYPYFMFTKVALDTLIQDQTSFLHGRNPSRNSVPMYAAISPCDPANDRVIITYYAFFAFNEGKEMCSLKFGKMHAGLPVFKFFDHCLGAPKRYFGSHVGDIERITIEFKNNAPERLVLSVHNVNVRYKFNGNNLFLLESAEKKGQVQVLDPPKSIAVVDGHPILYAAKGSHAMYGATGEYKYHALRLPGLSDETAWGEVWDTWKNLDVFFADKAPTWFYYDGKWGNPKSECTGALQSLHIGSEVCTYETGPIGFKRDLDIKC